MPDEILHPDSDATPEEVEETAQNGAAVTETAAVTESYGCGCLIG